MLKATKRLKIITSQHLKEGNLGWRHISDQLLFFNNNYGINFYEWVDKAVISHEINDPWAGFLHNVITYPEKDYPKKYTNRIKSISQLTHDEYFLEKLQTCKGLFVFTKQIQNYLKTSLKFEKIYFIYHPVVKPKFKWVKDSYVIHVGQHLRKYHSFLSLKSKRKKYFLQPHRGIFKEHSDIEEMKHYADDQSIIYIDRLNAQNYFNFLSSSIVFMDLYDVAACNTLLECLIMNVPVMVNRLEGCLEYLGDKYPFYFSSLEEAEEKIHDDKLIKQTHLYLKNMNKEHLSINSFTSNFYTYSLKL